ncbi:MAG: ParB/RepB/Spo0J family partition protein [Rhodobacteraceae bacterium]|nr:ParB/RepB/Spo0J family partition protein [Paracoccaceae bacterium]
MDKKLERRGLGRGLSALMSDVNLGSNEVADSPQRFPAADLMIAVERIRPNPKQPRRDFDQAALEELAGSIRTKGIIQPIIVRPTADDGDFEIVAGERRWRAAQLAQLHQVPVVVRSFSDAEMLEIAIIENIQRADLNAVEEALGFKQLMENFGHTQEKLADALSKSRSHIANTLRLLSLPDDVLQMIRSGKLTAGHARALIGASDPVALAAKVIGAGLSVRETEKLAKRAMQKPDRSNSRARETEKDADTRAIEADLSANLGMSVTIDHDPAGEGGFIKVRYRTLGQLDMLCQMLSVIPRDFKAD